MRDREDVAARLVLVGLQNFPQVFRIVTSHRPHGRVRLDLARLVGAVAEDHDAMQVVAPGVRRPFIADEGREAAGVVVGLGRAEVLFPSRTIERRAGQRREGRRKLPPSRMNR